MSTWLLVWFIVTIVSTAAVIAILVALIRHAIVVGRSARELQEAVRPLADEISSEGQRASDRAAAIEIPGRGSAGRR